MRITSPGKRVMKRLANSTICTHEAAQGLDYLHKPTGSFVTTRGNAYATRLSRAMAGYKNALAVDFLDGKDESKSW